MLIDLSMVRLLNLLRSAESFHGSPFARPITRFRAMATMIEMIATTIGTNAATTVPNTINRMISATGTPIDSPLRKSSRPTSSNALPIVACPVSKIVNELAVFRLSTISRTRGTLSVASTNSPAVTNGMIVVRRSADTRKLVSGMSVR